MSNINLDLSKEAIKTYLQDQTENSKNSKIFLVGKDDAGREYLQVADRGLGTWFKSKVLGKEEYKLDKVTSFLNDHKIELNEIQLPTLNGKKATDVLFNIVDSKVAHYNLSRSTTNQIETLSKKMDDTYQKAKAEVQSAKNGIESTLIDMTKGLTSLLKLQCDSFLDLIDDNSAEFSSNKPNPSGHALNTLEYHYEALKKKLIEIKEQLTVPDDSAYYKKDDTDVKALINEIFTEAKKLHDNANKGTSTVIKNSAVKEKFKDLGNNFAMTIKKQQQIFLSKTSPDNNLRRAQERLLAAEDNLKKLEEAKPIAT